MADTPRTLSQLQSTYLADNTTGDISPQDVRDFLVSVFPYSGTALLDFGAFPGSSDTSIAITGQTNITASSVVEAWLRPTLTEDHTADEHIVESIKLFAGNISAGVGFTIYGVNDSHMNEPVENAPNPGSFSQASAAGIAARFSLPRPGVYGGIGTRIYGSWAVQWRWS